MMRVTEYSLIKTVQGFSFHKKPLLAYYEKYKKLGEIDKELIPLCDLINYKCQDINTIFCCSGHGDGGRSGYITLKFKDSKFISIIMNILLPANEANDENYRFLLRNRQKQLCIYFRSENFKIYNDILTLIFQNYEELLIRDSEIIPVFDSDRNFIKYELNIFDYMPDDEYEKLKNISRKRSEYRPM